MSTTPELAPVSGAQRYCWDCQSAGWSNEAVPLFWRLEGRLDRDALFEATDRLFARHEALRTTIGYRGDELLQHIWPARPTTIVETRIRSARSVTDRAVGEALAAEVYAPFDLATSAPLARASLFSAGEDDHVFGLVMHHAIADGWSCGVLDTDFRGLLTGGAGAGEGPPAASPRQLRDYATWEQRQDAARSAAFWQRRLAPTQFRLDVDGSGRPSGAVHLFEDLPTVDAGRIAQLHEIVARKRVPLSAALFGAIAIALSPWTSDAIRIGGVVADRFHPRFQSVVGPLFTMLPLRIVVSADATFADVVADVGRDWLAALAQRVSLGVMYDLAGTEPLVNRDMCDVIVNFFPYAHQPPTSVTHPGGEVRISGHVAPDVGRRVRAWWRPADNVVGLTMGLDASGGLWMKAEADERACSREALVALGEHLVRVLVGLIQAPEAPVREVVSASCRSGVVSPASKPAPG